MLQGMTKEDFIEDHVSMMFVDKNGNLQLNKNIDADIKYYSKLYDDMVEHEKREGIYYE